jgi:hypothetical protein
MTDNRLASKESDSLQGLNCPNCGGMVSVPEGQLIVHCPYCEMRSFVRGERGILRYQVPQRLDRAAAAERLGQFLSSSMQIAPAARRGAQLTETFLVYLPFWTVWSTVGGWVFGEKRVGSGDKARYEPREVRLVQQMSWNGSAFDPGEFGVEQVPFVEGDLQPFDPDELHNRGMVFEPVGAFSEARREAEAEFEQQVRRKAGLDRVGQIFVRSLRRRYALVYHPLWVLRYGFRERAFQVVVDGFSGQVLYGKAPGNTLYRALALVGGMAIGAFLAVDVSAALLYLLGDSNDGGGIAAAALGALALGAGLMYAGYRKFRHGEQYEFRQAGQRSPITLGSLTELAGSVKDVEQWIKQFS